MSPTSVFCVCGKILFHFSIQEGWQQHIWRCTPLLVHKLLAGRHKRDNREWLPEQWVSRVVHAERQAVSKATGSAFPATLTLPRPPARPPARLPARPLQEKAGDAHGRGEERGGAPPQDRERAALLPQSFRCSLLFCSCYKDFCLLGGARGATLFPLWIDCNWLSARFLACFLAARAALRLGAGVWSHLHLKDEAGLEPSPAVRALCALTPPCFPVCLPARVPVCLLAE